MLAILKKLLPSLETEVKAGRVSPAHYIIAAALLLIADDIDAIRKTMTSPAPSVGPQPLRPKSKI